MVIAILHPTYKHIQFGYIRHKNTYSMTDSVGVGIALPNDEEEKDFGIMFKLSLKFDKHVQNVVNRTKRLTGHIKRTFKCMNKTLFLTFFINITDMFKSGLW